MSARRGNKRSKLKRVISKTAPALAHALGGPLAGVAVEQISKAIFGAPTENEEALHDALQMAGPEQWTALKLAEFEFRRALRDASIAELRVHADDRANARKRQATMEDWTPSALGAAIVLGFFLVLGVMITQKLPDGAETEFSIMLGALATMAAAVVNYFFGSSSGSKEKTRMMIYSS